MHPYFYINKQFTLPFSHEDGKLETAKDEPHAMCSSRMLRKLIPRKTETYELSSSHNYE